MMLIPGKCRSSGAAIYWLRNNNTGALSPIDAAPSEDGNCTVSGDGYYTVVGKDLFSEQVKAGEPRHKNHFATCPNAAKHKRKKQ